MLTMFETATKLHYSQTHIRARNFVMLFETATKLHYSQTAAHQDHDFRGLRPLRNYTTLKHDGIGRNK